MSSQTTAICSIEETVNPEIDPEQNDVGENNPCAQVDEDEAKSALASLTPTLGTLVPEDIRSLKVGVTTAVSIGLAYASAYREDRPVFEEAFKTSAFEAESYANLADRAKAFWQADILLRQELNTEGPLRALMADAKPLRSKMVKAANYLWNDDPDLSDVVKNISKGVGYTNHADDLGRLASLFADYWSQADGHCDVTLEDIATAERLGAAILQAMSPSSKEEIGEIKRLRYQAAEYLRRGIEDVRAAASYVFRDDDKKMERYPSLFVRKRRKTDKPKANGEVSSDSVVPAPVAEPSDSELSPQEPAPFGDNLSAIPQLG